MSIAPLLIVIACIPMAYVLSIPVIRTFRGLGLIR